MKTKRLPRYLVSSLPRALALLVVLISWSAQALDIGAQKLTGRWGTTSVPVTPTNFKLGEPFNGVAISSKWVLVGATNAADRGLAGEGAVQVFDAVSGNWLRKLLPPGVAAAGIYFGVSTAISGDLGIVGAYGVNGFAGAVYIFNLTNGSLVRTLTAFDGAVGDIYGGALAVSGDTLAVGAYGDDATRGSVYLYRLSTGAYLTKLTGADSVAGDAFSYAIAAEGSILAVGAPVHDGNKGAVYLFDLSSYAQVKKYQPAGVAAFNQAGVDVELHQGLLITGGSGKAWLHDLVRPSVDAALTPTSPAASSTFGQSLAVQGELIMIGDWSVSGNTGAVHLFNASTGAWIKALSEPSGATGTNFAKALAADGTTLLASSYTNDTLATDSGCAYLLRPLPTQPMRYAKVTARGDFAASGTPAASTDVELNIGTIGDVFANPAARTTISTTFTGLGSNSNKDYGVVSEIVDNFPRVIGKTRNSLDPGITVSSLTKPTSNDYSIVFGMGTRSGTGISSLNNGFLWYREFGVASNTYFLVSGNAVAELGGGTLLSVQELVSSNQSTMRKCAAVCTLRSGVGGITSATDTGIVAKSINSATSEGVREGDAAAGLPLGTFLGQFAPRVAHHFQSYLYSTALLGTGITSVNNAALYEKFHGSAPTLIAQKGATIAPDQSAAAMPGVTFTSFIGEASDGSSNCVFRATIAGPSPTVTSTTNEGIWRGTGAENRLRLRKGDTITGLTGVKIYKIIAFTGSRFDDGVFALVQLTGTGVSSANDMALIHAQSNYTYNVLMREGDAAPGCTPAKIGVISRYAFDSYSGNYLVIATLTGAPTGTDLALFKGTLNLGNNTNQQALRRPVLRLRKGELFDNQPSKLKSFDLPTSNWTASGAGSTGRGNSLSWNDTLAFTVEFDNAVRQVVKGAHSN